MNLVKTPWLGCLTSNPGVRTPIPVLSALPFGRGGWVSATKEKLSLSILGRKT